MDEEKKELNKQPANAGDAGLQLQGSKMLTELDSRIERLREENDRAERINTERAELMARERMGGKSESADNAPKKELSDEEYYQKAKAGQLDNGQEA